MKMLHLAILFCVISTISCKNEYPEITLSHNGKVGGMTLKSLDEREFFAFRGIPYAEPPVGELRFKAPEPIEPWEGVRDATRESSPCAQVPLIGEERLIGSEDCLYLNVYTPKLPKEDEERLPVIFWIHGGAFYAGDGGIEENGPEFLMDQDVVLVTINYRLGAFGFLSSGDQKIPGNFGMKDQVLALKWVQENIEFFNGDKSRVTLWGYSAGGAAVEAHLFSPMSTGLFHGAIYQSGTLKSECALKTKPALSLQVLGSVVKCYQIKTEDQLDCLRSLPASDIAKAINSFPYWGMKFPAAFSIVQELPNHLDQSWSEEPFLTVNPNKMLQQGKIINDVPTLTGIAKDEGIILGYALQQTPGLYKQANKNFNDVARLGSCLIGYKPKKVEKIKKFYFGEEKINEKQFDNFLKFQSDAVWNWPQIDTAFKHAKASKSPVYFYLFSFEGRISEAMAAGLEPIKGVGHADDLAYIMRRRVPFPDGEPNEREKKTIKRMGSILESFARTGNPNPKDNELFDIEWEPIDPENFKYLNIDENLEMAEGYPFSYRMDFWRELNTKKKSKDKDEL